MIVYETVLEIHTVLVKTFGGAAGVRDIGLLSSAIERPFSGFGNDLFYLTPEEQAAAIIESILVNHPFVDGNKRTGYVLMRLILLQSKKNLIATEDEKYLFVIDIASSKLKYDEIVAWIKSHVTT